MLLSTSMISGTMHCLTFRNPELESPSQTPRHNTSSNPTRGSHEAAFFTSFEHSIMTRPNFKQVELNVLLAYLQLDSS